MRSLVYGNILAGPAYIILTIGQIVFIPDFFQLETTDTSLLSQTKFILSGILLLVGAIGLINLLSNDEEGKIGAIFLGIGGIGIIMAGIIPFFEESGFLYNFIFILGITLGIGLVASCLVFIKYFKEEKNWYYFSIVTGIIIFLVFLGLLFLKYSQYQIPIEFASFVLFCWISLVSLKIMNQPAS